MADADTPTTDDTRIAVVTGATRGIGRAVAGALAAAGMHVVAIGRTVGALEEFDDEARATGGSATLVPLDLQDFAAIDRLGAAIHERWGRLDVLVGAAATLGKLMPAGHVPPKVWDEVMAVNATASWRLIRSLDPLLRLSPAGRAVFVTCAATRTLRPFWGPYTASKAALEALVACYAAEMRSTSVRVNLVDPGPARTRLRAEAAPGEDPSALPAPETLAPGIAALCDARCALHGERVELQGG
jgi:NAD(P)-dependent dehydrogenase (short-subunit alcohol dehydrogenase family)